MGPVLLTVEVTSLASVVAIAAALLLALLRPHESAAERRERRLRLLLLEAELLPEQRCLSCLTPTDDAFRCCPGCGEALRRECTECERLLGLGWAVCPWCLAEQAPVRAAA